MLVKLVVLQKQMNRTGSVLIDSPDYPAISSFGLIEAMEW